MTKKSRKTISTKVYKSTTGRSGKSGQGKPLKIRSSPQQTRERAAETNLKYLRRSKHVYEKNEEGEHRLSIKEQKVQPYIQKEKNNMKTPPGIQIVASIKAERVAENLKWSRKNNSNSKITKDDLVPD